MQGSRGDPEYFSNSTIWRWLHKNSDTTSTNNRMSLCLSTVFGTLSTHIDGIVDGERFWPHQASHPNQTQSCVAPQGTARTNFLNCLKAGANLLVQFQFIHPDGTIQQTKQYNQMKMLLRCAPILLLQQESFHRQNFTNIVNRRCTQFLRGEWQRLFQTIIENDDLQNEIQVHWSRQKQQRTSNTRQNVQFLLQARNLNYSRAMNLIRSTELSEDSPELIHAQLNLLKYYTLPIVPLCNNKTPICGSKISIQFHHW